MPMLFFTHKPLTRFKGKVDMPYSVTFCCLISCTTWIHEVENVRASRKSWSCPPIAMNLPKSTDIEPEGHKTPLPNPPSPGGYVDY